MFRLRGKGAEMRKKLASFTRVKDASADPVSLCARAIMDALSAREQEGETTTLRQLHLVTDFSQREALKAVAALEELELVEVDRNLHDALESRIDLTEEMRKRLADSNRRSAA